MENFKATTIIAVKKDGKTAIAGDGQVTFGQAAIMKANARKVRRLYNGKVFSWLCRFCCRCFYFI